MSSPLSDERIDGADPDSDLLLGERRPRRGAAAVVALVLVALAGWWLLRDDSSPAPARIPAAAVATSAPAAAGTEPGSGAQAQSIDQLTFLDDDYGVALRLDCATVNSRGYCPRSLLDTVDGGATWTVRGDLPRSADGYDRLVLDPDGPLAVVADGQLATMYRSIDRGATWRPVPLRAGAPAPAPRGTQLLTTGLPNCQVGCSRLLWVDVSESSTHPVPTQPQPDGDSDLWFAAPGTSDGLLAATDQAGTVAVSSDGGGTWRVTSLPVVVPPGQRLFGSVIRPSNGGRVYAFVQLEGTVGLETAYGFRTDDVGVSWTDIGFQGRPVWLPAGTVDGELITTDLPGAVFLSRGDGTAFDIVPATPRAMFLSQGEPDGVVLGTVRDEQGRSTYFLSRDGLAWAPLRLPAG